MMIRFKQSMTRALLAMARTFTPVLRWKNNTFVFRAEDVKEVLNRNQDFTIAEINGPNIERLIGPYILGMDDGPQYQRDIGILRAATKREDGERISSFVRKEAVAIVDNLPKEFDLVQSFTRQLPYLLIADYFGTPGPDRSSMLRWNRSIFWDVFLDLKDEPEVRSAALRSSSEMVPYIKEQIKENKNRVAQGLEIEDNMLNRLIKMQDEDVPSFSDEEMAGNFAGTLMGTLEPINKACVYILQQFFSRKEILKKAIQAAKSDDTQTMKELALEALRFQPNMPVLMRFSKEEQELGKRRIRAGQTVYAMTYSAMFDPRQVEQPKRFLPGRPVEDMMYLGFGQHRCFGNYINLVAIPEMLNVLLKIEGLRPKGKVIKEGPFPDRWIFEKD